MSLYRTGALIIKSFKPVLVNPCFIIPSSVNIQIRHAGRKFTRDKMKKKSKEAAASKAASKSNVTFKMKGKLSKFEKTLDLKKPEPPNDSIIILKHFNYKKLSLSEAVKFHREYHHPTVFNNPKAVVSVKIEINMEGKSKFQFIKPFSGVADIPHPFVISHQKEVLVLCNPEDKDLATASGASLCGGVELVKKIKEGVIQPSLYDHVIAHVNFLPQMTPIRTLLKDQIPRAKIGTLTNDLKTAIRRFRHGIQYSCIRIGTADDFGIIGCSIGTIDMDLNHLEENLKALLKDIETKKPPRPGTFVTWIWCKSPPSPEEFSLELPLYLDKQVEKDIDEDEEVQEISETQAAKSLELDCSFSNIIGEQK